MSHGPLQALLRSLNWADCRIRPFDTFYLRNIKVFPFTRRICTSRMAILASGDFTSTKRKHNLVLETNSQTHSYGTRSRDDFRTIQARNSYAVHCIVFSGLCLYNGIPNNLKDTPNIELFKKRLKQYLKSQ
jgi:hypothetical protein